MEKAIKHFRGNAVAYLALFVALGGTGYAAVSIPRNSVGTRQLKNGAVTGSKLAKGSVTAAKLDGRSIAGYIAFWAEIDQGGRVLASSAPATTTDWSTGIGEITFAGALSKCFPLATDAANLNAGYVSVVSGVNRGNTTLVATMPSPEAINIVDICP